MNYEQRKELFDAIVENELRHISDENLEGMDNSEEYEKLQHENSLRYEAISKALPKELKEVLFEYEATAGIVMGIEASHYFKKGVSAGLTDLNFLNKVTQGNVKFY